MKSYNQRYSQLISFTALVLVFLSLTGCDSDEAPTPGLTEQEKSYTVVVNDFYRYSLAASELAATNSDNDSVKAFAADMLVNYKQAHQWLTAFASKNNIALSDSLMPMYQMELKSLTGTKSRSFDNNYMSAMSSFHQSTAEDLTEIKKLNKDPELKEFAAEALTEITNNQKRAHAIFLTLGE